MQFRGEILLKQEEFIFLRKEMTLQENLPLWSVTLDEGQMRQFVAHTSKGDSIVIIEVTLELSTEEPHSGYCLPFPGLP